MKRWRAFVVCALVFGGSSQALAMPWDVDLFRQPSLRSKGVARAAVKGTVPVGHPPFTLSTEDAEKVLRNPVPLSDESIVRGHRLFAVNCIPCHGATADGKGPVGPAMGAPDIRTDFYKARGDGRLYGIFMNGGTNMPRYGYKFSEAERWDLVNYVRYLQGKRPGDEAAAAGPQRDENAAQLLDSFAPADGTGGK